ncbi:MAG TPA: hypothetical protein VK663_15295, partial [Burkholderiales bacterium]|nr:hypothetical protein [Burkholderiales bacterium]
VIVENASNDQRKVIPTTVGGLPAAAQGVGAGPALVMVGEVYADVQTALSGDVMSPTLQPVCKSA